MPFFKSISNLSKKIFNSKAKSPDTKTAKPKQHAKPKATNREGAKIAKGKEEGYVNENEYDGSEMTALSDTAQKPFIPDWLIKDFWITGDTGVLSGQKKRGKTWFILDMAISIASGTPFLGKFSVTKPGKVIIYTPELNRDQMDGRISEIAVSRNLDQSGRWRDNIYSDHQFGLNLENKGHQRMIEDKIKSIQPVMYIFDPLSCCFAGSENASTRIGGMTKWFAAMSRVYDCSVIIVHHTSKNIKGPDFGGRGSGEIGAFGGTNMSLFKVKELVTLATESRHISNIDNLNIKLVGEEFKNNHLVVDETPTNDTCSHKNLVESRAKKILEVMEEHDAFFSFRLIEKIIGGNEGICRESIRSLIEDAQIVKGKNSLIASKWLDGESVSKKVSPVYTQRTGLPGKNEKTAE